MNAQKQQVAQDVPLWRVLVCHKHSVSARLRFLVPESGGVCLPWKLPSLTVFIEDESVSIPVETHPAILLQKINAEIKLDSELFFVPGFRLNMETPDGAMPVYLVALSAKDITPAPAGLRWIELPDSIPMPWLDRELLRRAYEFLIGFDS